MKRGGIPVDSKVCVPHQRSLFRAIDFAPVAKPKREAETARDGELQAREEPDRHNGTGPSPLHQQEGQTLDPVSQGIPAGGVQEKSLFGCGSRPLEHGAPRGGTRPSCPLGLPERPVNLALPMGQGP